ncbi:MAG: GNAT family N-acetyltransferase [Anaerolineae bacterium]|nr:GNAT family N-acetyltransferase [Anaerolineae bacterium]
MDVQPEVSFSIQLAITIRQMQERDLPLLEWHGEFEHFRQVFRRSYQDQHSGRRCLLVADCNQYPVGRLFILYESRNQYLADGHQRAYLYSFAVLPLFRRQQIGTRLILAAEEILRRQHYSRATIAVAQDNEGALRLYQRHGYTIFGEDDGRWRYTDHRGMTRHVYEPCWLLEKTLTGDE